MDVLIAVSICPSGTGTYHWRDAEKDTISPLEIENHDTDVEPLVFENMIGEHGFLCECSRARGKQ